MGDVEMGDVKATDKTSDINSLSDLVRHYARKKNNALPPADDVGYENSCSTYEKTKRLSGFDAVYYAERVAPYFHMTQKTFIEQCDAAKKEASELEISKAIARWTPLVMGVKVLVSFVEGLQIPIQFNQWDQILFNADGTFKQVIPVKAKQGSERVRSSYRIEINGTSYRTEIYDNRARKWLNPNSSEKRDLQYIVEHIPLDKNKDVQYFTYRFSKFASTREIRFIKER